MATHFGPWQLYHLSCNFFHLFHHRVVVRWQLRFIAMVKAHARYPSTRQLLLDRYVINVGWECTPFLCISLSSSIVHGWSSQRNMGLFLSFNTMFFIFMHQVKDKYYSLATNCHHRMVTTFSLLYKQDSHIIVTSSYRQDGNRVFFIGPL